MAVRPADPVGRSRLLLADDRGNPLHRRHGRVGRHRTPVRGSIKKFVEITREMTRIGDKRRAMAMAAEAEGHLVTARQNYFTAAAYYTMAQGPIHEDGDAVNLALSAKKNACYEKFIAARRAPDREGRDSVRERVAARLPAFSAERVGTHALRGVPGRHGQLQGNAGDEPERQVPRARDGGARVRRARPERGADLAQHPLHREQLHRRRQVGDGFPARPRRRRPRAHRHHRHQHGLVLAHADRGARPSLQGGGRVLHLPRARPAHLAQRGDPDVQGPLHVDGGLSTTRTSSTRSPRS